MTAKEMFKELGLEFSKSEDSIEYYKYFHEHHGVLSVLFKDKDVLVRYCRYESGEEKPVHIDTQALKAINKQFEELGWLE